MKNTIKALLAGLVIAGITCGAYLIIVGIGCLGPSSSGTLIPNCVNVFHPLMALFLGSISLSIFCGVLLGALRDYK